MRQLSIQRRKPGLVDLLIIRTANAVAYKLRWSNNFDAAVPVNFLEVPQSGYRDPAVSDAGDTTLYGNRVRAVFNPATFGIPDDSPWWLRVSPLNAAGAEIHTTPPLMVVAPDPSGSYLPQLSVTGVAPNVVDLAHALEFHLPRQMKHFRVQNLASMFVAFHPGGPEMQVPASPTPKDLSWGSTSSSIFVRGDGAAVPFSMMFAPAYTI
jgi:hypothetical protein